MANILPASSHTFFFLLTNKIPIWIGAKICSIGKENQHFRLTSVFWPSSMGGILGKLLCSWYKVRPPTGTRILLFVLHPYTCLNMESLSCDPGMESVCMMVTQEARNNSLCTSGLCFMRKTKTKTKTSLLFVHTIIWWVFVSWGWSQWWPTLILYL